MSERRARAQPLVLRGASSLRGGTVHYVQGASLVLRYSPYSSNETHQRPPRLSPLQLLFYHIFHYVRNSICTELFIICLKITRTAQLLIFRDKSESLEKKCCDQAHDIHTRGFLPPPSISRRLSFCYVVCNGCII